MIKKIILSFVFISLFFFDQQLAGQSKKYRYTSIDSVTDIKINKLVFYKDPLRMEYGYLVDTTYIPEWFKAHCAYSNCEYFKDFPKEAVGLFQKNYGYTEEFLADFEKKIKEQGGLRKIKPFPYEYTAEEIWFTYLKTGDQYLILRTFESKNKIPDLKFIQPIVKKNKPNEKIDSVDNGSSVIYYIYEDGILKVANQEVAQSIIDSNPKIRWSLTDFKNVLYRSSEYIVSEVKNGKRIFTTIQNTTLGPIRKDERGRP